jgi:pimeloyl-ACP methyl ester carboxylesterase
MPCVRANGLDVGYEVDGAGPPLVMLHGATSSGREDFAAQVPLFRRAFRCYVPDARGHASTRWDAAGGFRYEWLIDDLAAFADELGLATFHLLGFSMGGATALGFAVRHPERMRTLVVAGITPRREPRASVVRRLMDPDRILRHDPRWARELAGRHDPVQGRGAWQRLLPAIAHDVAEQRLLEPADLVRIDAPTLVAVGDRDQFVPVDHAWPSSASCRMRGCSSCPTAATRSRCAGRHCSTRRWPASTARPRRSPRRGPCRSRRAAADDARPRRLELGALGGGAPHRPTRTGCANRRATPDPRRVRRRAAAPRRVSPGDALAGDPSAARELSGSAGRTSRM